MSYMTILADALKSAHVDVKVMSDTYLEFSVPFLISHRKGSRLLGINNGWLKIDHAQANRLVLSYALDIERAALILPAFFFITFAASLGVYIFLDTFPLTDVLILTLFSIFGSGISVLSYFELKDIGSRRFQYLLKRYVYDLANKS